MDKKVRIRETKANAEQLLLKMLPLIFMMLLFMLTSSMGLASEGAIGSGID
jgi:hypothetical protein